MKKKRLLFLFLCICIDSSMHAQIAKWVVKPQYDQIEIVDDKLIKVSLNGKYGFINREGKRVVPIEYDSITPFYEDYALLFKEGEFYGIINANGHVTELKNRGILLCFDNSRFYNGLLLVKKNNLYYFLNGNGKEVAGPYAKAYPFFDGRACVKRYFNDGRKQDGVFYDYIGVNGEKNALPKINKEDITFMSSFRNDTAIVVVKKKFYIITSNDYELKQISIDGSLRKESFVVSEKKVIDTIPCREGYKLRAKNATFVFDNFMRPLYWELKGQDRYEFLHKQENKPIDSSRFSLWKEGNKSGLYLDGKEFLPPQFDRVHNLYDNIALVEIDRKVGILTVDDKEKFKFALNEDEKIGFEHKSFETKVKVFMPTYIDHSTATIVSHSDDCKLQLESRKSAPTIEVTVLEYKCKLSISKDLTDEPTNRDYYYSIKYEGLESIPHKVSIEQWYVKHYDVKMSQTNFTLSSIDDTISLEFEVSSSKNNERNYYKDVRIVNCNYPDNIIEGQAINTNRYPLKIFGMKEGCVNFSVRVKEDECPYIDFPFEIIFTKKEIEGENTSTTVEVKEIRKKRKNNKRNEQKNNEDNEPPQMVAPD